MQRWVLGLTLGGLLGVAAVAGAQPAYCFRILPHIDVVTVLQTANSHHHQLSGGSARWCAAGFYCLGGNVTLSHPDGQPWVWLVSGQFTNLTDSFLGNQMVTLSGVLGTPAEVPVNKRWTLLGTGVAFDGIETVTPSQPFMSQSGSEAMLTGVECSGGAPAIARMQQQLMRDGGTAAGCRHGGCEAR
jgi:hypothetical protein